MIFDAHTHLNDEKLFVDWKSYVDQFIQSGGGGLINVWASDAFNANWLLISQEVERSKGAKEQRFKGVIVRATLGFHPDELSNGHLKEDEIPAKIQELKDLYEANKEHIVAIGECGIDVHYPGTKEILPAQKKLFIAQCELASQLDLPLVVHSRDDFESTFEILKNYKNLVIYFHCWPYGPDEIKRLKDLKIERLFIGFCGNITYKKSENLLATLREVSLDQLLLETDAPWLAPQVVRGTTNQPANVGFIYEFVSEFLQISFESLTLQIEKNFKTVYQL